MFTKSILPGDWVLLKHDIDRRIHANFVSWMMVESVYGKYPNEKYHGYFINSCGESFLPSIRWIAEREDITQRIGDRPLEKTFFYEEQSCPVCGNKWGVVRNA